MSQRLLIKSRFKLALDCPNKLFYTRKKEYANQQLNDPFLEALSRIRGRNSPCALNFGSSSPRQLNIFGIGRFAKVLDDKDSLSPNA